MPVGFPAEGGCACGQVRYRMLREPLFVHCCHCTWCQRETGAAFALNALIESSELELLTGVPDKIETPSASGQGQVIVRCPACEIALWSHYAGAGEKLSFIRAGSMDQPELAPPDVHIYTSTRQPWLRMGDGVPEFQEYYDAREQWPATSLERYRAMKAGKG